MSDRTPPDNLHLDDGTDRNVRFAWTVLVLGVLPIIASISSLMQYRGLLLALYLLLALLALVGGLRRADEMSDFMFMTLVLSVSLCLILSSAFVSQNLRGYDIHDEYYQFVQVYSTGRWSIVGNDIYDSVLSVTVLPTIVSHLSGIDGLKIFEVVFPALYSIVPLALYRVYRKILTPSAAFLGTFLFMAYPVFFEEIRSVTRQEIAELVMVILLLVLLTPRVSRSLLGKLLILVLTLGLIASHYSLAYLFLALLAISFMASRFFRRSALSGVSLSTLLIAVILTFGWYSSVAGGTGLLSITGGLSFVYGGVQNDLFALSSRPAIVQEAATFGGMAGLLHDANRLSQYVVQVFLLLGCFALLLKRKKSIPEYQFLPFTLGAMALLVGSVFLPFFASLLNLTRIYHIALIFVAPCFCYGVDIACSIVKPLRPILSNLFRPKAVPFRVSRSLAAAILICYFLFVSGWFWAVSMDRPTSMILDASRMQSYDVWTQQSYYLDLTSSPDISASRWIQSTSPQQNLCSSHAFAYQVLNSYGDRPRAGQYATQNIQYGYCTPGSGSLIFFSEYETSNGIILSSQYNALGYLTLPAPNVSMTDRIYSDGATIYRD